MRAIFKPLPLTVLTLTAALILFAPGPGAGAAAPAAYDMLTAVERALAENFKILSAEQDLDAGEQARRSALGAFGPSLGVSYGGSRLEHREEDEYSWRLALTQNLFAGFATLASYQKAALQRDNAEARLTQARLNLVLQVQQNFLLYLKAEANVRSSSDSYNRLLEQLKVTTSFYEVGLRPRVEVLQAEVNVSEAEDLLLRNRNDVEIQRVRLNTLLNLPAQQTALYVGSLEYIPFTDALDLEQCLEKAYAKRPDVLIAQKSVRIAQKDQTLAESRFLPKVSASGSWSSAGDSWRAAGSAARPDNYKYWSVGLEASLSLFESGSDYFSRRQSLSLVKKLQADEAALRQEVVYEVQSRLLALDNARKRIVVARKGVEQATEAYRVAAARYKSQVGASIDVLDAQARLSAAEVSFTGAQADYLSALAAAYAAIGEENPALLPK